MTAVSTTNLEKCRRERRRGVLQSFSRIDRRIDRSPLSAFFLLSAFYIVAVYAMSSFKLLWLDELITFHIARLGSPSDIWQALSRGADPNPPVTHLLVAFCRSILGDHEFAYRTPAVIGYWAGLFALFAYLRRRVPATWALIGTITSMCMAAFDYSYESRSYGIFYGLAMLAFWCWTVTADDTRSSRAHLVALLGMTFALALGISTNYFAVLAFLPIAAGETARTFLAWRRSNRSIAQQPSRILRFQIWIALLVAGTPLLAFRPLIEHSIAQFAPYAWNKVSMNEVFDSYTEMVEIILYPILALFGLAILFACLSHFYAVLCRECRSRLTPRWLSPLINRPDFRLPTPGHEAVGVLFLMAYPFLGYAVASVRGGMLSPRFVIPVCFGFAIAATLVAFETFGAVPWAPVALLSLVGAWFICRESYVGYWYEEQKQCFYKVLEHLPEAEQRLPANAPIAVPDPLLALTLEHYAPPPLAHRLVFPVDFPAVRHYRHDDSPEENLWAGRNFLYTLPIEPLATFENSAAQYLIIAGDGNWMLQDLDRHHYPLDRLPINTRAGAIGGFTPLARGTPVFYLAEGDQSMNEAADPLRPPVPFVTADNLPTGTFRDPPGDLQ